MTKKYITAEEAEKELRDRGNLDKEFIVTEHLHLSGGIVKSGVSIDAELMKSLTIEGKCSNMILLNGIFHQAVNIARCDVENMILFTGNFFGKILLDQVNCGNAVSFSSEFYKEVCIEKSFLINNEKTYIDCSGIFHDDVYVEGGKVQKINFHGELRRKFFLDIKFNQFRTENKDIAQIASWAKNDIYLYPKKR